MLNSILESGVIPVGMKTSIVKPPYKEGKCSSISSYRPSSIGSSLSLILEKYIVGITNSFLNKLNILSKHQFGFIAGRGTRHLLETFSDKLFYAFKKNNPACVLFPDVLKAFDIIGHDVLLDKLFHYVLRGPFLTIFIQ